MRGRADLQETMARKYGQGTLPNKAKLKKEEKDLQTQAMVVARVSESKTYEQLALMFGVSRETVKKRLADARAQQFAALSQEIIAERMLPKALTVLEQELEKGNYEAAKDLLFGLQVYQKGGKAVIEHVTSNSPTLESIRRERAKAIEAEVVKVEDAPPSDDSSGTDASS
jgi:hypothetical protein